MIHTLRSEWIKLRTVLVHWVLVVVAVLFPIVVTTLTSIFADFGESGGELSRNIASLVSGVSVVSAMLLGSLSAISLTSEYAHSTIRPTYAATPSRSRVIAAKLAVNTAVVLAVMLLTVLAGWVLASVILSGRDHPIAIGDEGVGRRLAAVALLGVVVAWFALGLALIIRNSPATVTILLLWPLLIENLLAGLFLAVGWQAVARWMPYSAGITAVVSDGENGDGSGGGVDALGWPWGLVYFAGVTVALVVVGTWLDRRRDA